MEQIITPRMLKAFIEQGLVPSDCSKLEIVLNAAGALVLRYDVMLRPHHLPKLAAAFTAIDDHFKVDRSKLGVEPQPGLCNAPDDRGVLCVKAAGHDGIHQSASVGGLISEWP